jgi:hypothetical protein
MNCKTSKHITLKTKGEKLLGLKILTLVATIIFLVVSQSSTGVLGSTKENTYNTNLKDGSENKHITNNYNEDEFIYSLEKTYQKFLQENMNSGVSYLNISGSTYINTVILEKTGSYYSITQEKIQNKWEYQTRNCRKQTKEDLEKNEIWCRTKTTSNPNWVEMKVSEPKNSLTWIMLEPITLTSWVVGESKPQEVKMSYIIKPGKSSNYYVNEYQQELVNDYSETSEIITKGVLTQEISSKNFKLTLQEEKPLKKKTVILVNIIN